MAKVKRSFYDKDFIPKNVEELYCSGWKEYLLYSIRKYSLKDVNNSPEDLLQDMILQLAEKQYIEKYDPSVSDFTVYLHTFVKNFMSKPYNREHHTVYGQGIVNASPIYPYADDSDDSSVAISPDVLSSGEGDFTDYVCLVQSLEKDLAEIKTKSKIEYNGKTIDRNPLTVYRLMREGYEVKDIAEMFGTSKQFVYTLRRKIIGLMESYA